MPEKEFTVASVSRIDDTRNHVEADVDVPAGDSSALLTFFAPVLSRLPGPDWKIARFGSIPIRLISNR